MSKAFTLIELLVVISIIVLITALTLPNYRSSDKQLALQRSAHKLAQSLRMAQEYAISVKEFSGAVPRGYGMYFDLDQPKSYILFADLNGDQAYSDTGEKVETVNLETNVILGDLAPVSPQSSLTVIFTPPDPTTAFSPDAASATITLKASGTEGPVTRYIYDYTWTVWGWVGDRASCDVDDSDTDCPNEFSAQQSDPSEVYDWYQWWFLRFSKKFEKEEREEISLLEKSVQVNRAGLIAVE